MKGFDNKGVSPVIATILLIALTVAAVGIVAVILSGYPPPGEKLNATLTTGSIYHSSKDWDNNKCTVEI